MKKADYTVDNTVGDIIMFGMSNCLNAPVATPLLPSRNANGQ